MSPSKSTSITPLPPWTFLNVNVPKGQPKGYRVTVQAKRNHVTQVSERHDPKGRPYSHSTPDLTAHDALAAVEDLCEEKPAGVR